MTTSHERYAEAVAGGAGGGGVRVVGGGRPTGFAGPREANMAGLSIFATRKAPRLSRASNTKARRVHLQRSTRKSMVSKSRFNSGRLV